MKKIIIVAGATASGKSGFAVQIAKYLNSEVISCDSMQIYKYMNIGTAKVSEAEMQGIKHHMIDIVEPSCEFSVSEYAQQAKPIIDNLCGVGKIPVIAGGTGLYVQSLLYPLTFSTDKNEDIRNQLLNELELYGAEYLHSQLEKVDPEDAKKIHPNNTKRLIRALEIIRITGKPKQVDELNNLQYDVLMLIPDIQRDILYSRINQRVEQMFDAGLKKEVDFLLSQNLVNFDCQSMQAIGYKEFKDYYNGLYDLQYLKELIKLNSRHYAKRQISWFKRYNFAKYVDLNNIDDIIQKINTFTEAK